MAGGLVKVGRDRFLIKVKVPVGKYFGMEPEDGFIELREPGNEDFHTLQAASKEGTKAMMDAFGKVSSTLIVDHNFEHEDGGALTAEEVAEILRDRPVLALEVIEKFTEKVLFIQGKKSAGR